MTESLVAAGSLAPADPGAAAAVGHAEGRAALSVMRRLREEDWRLPTDCSLWDVRALVAHLVGQCEDGIQLSTLLRRELRGRLRYRDRAGVDAHMAVQVDDHAAAAGPDLVERFATLWPRAVNTRRNRPKPLRRMRINLGIPGLARVPIGYLLDIIYNRDLWMHRVDLVRATDQPFVAGQHDRHIIDQALRDLALSWAAPPVALQLTGAVEGSWLLGRGVPVASARADAVTYMRALAGRDPDVALTRVTGDQTALASIRQARIPF